MTKYENVYDISSFQSDERMREQNPRSRKLGKAAVGLLVAGTAAVGLHTADKIHDYSQSHPGGTNLEQIQRQDGVNPNSAPALTEQESQIVTYVVPTEQL